MTSDFVHLHTHSDNSPLDGKPSVESMVATAVADHQRAIAITDHGNNAGSLALARAAQVAGIKAIGGQEMYLAVGSRFEENRFTSVDEFEGSKARPYYHLTVLTKSAAGWSNLMAINNAAMHTVLYKPRADYDLLRAHGDGLILGTGCLGGPVAQELLNGDPDTAMARARTAVEELLSVVGGDKERLFVEVMNHAIPAEAKIINGLASLADYYGLRIVATNDAHFTTADQKDDHDRLLAIGVNKQFNDPDRFRFKGDLSYWMKTEAEMRATFPATIGGQDVISNSVAIAEMVEGDLIDFMPENRPRLPKFPVPASSVEAFESGAVGAAACANPTEYMMFLKVYNGAVRRFGLPLSQEVRDRLRFELNVINGFGFCDYFLIVSELTDWCRSLGKVMGPGRGSAAGSLVGFCLEITDIDPLKHNLLFERFLDVFRKDPPDIDLDFPASMEQQVYEHFVQLYGASSVARIGTFSTKQARAILGDIGRLSGAASEGIKLKASLPARNTNKIKLAEYLNPGAIADEKRSELARVEGAELRKLVSASATPLYRQITEQALRLEGVRSGFGIHACGIVVSDQPLTRLVPLRIDPKTGQQVTLWSAPELESLGFIKMDALTIDNLDVIVSCLQGIKEGTGEDIDVAYGKLPMDGAVDRRAQAAWDLIGRGDTSGLFQIEGGGITKVAMDVAPSALDDLSAVVALYRPGPMKAGMPARFAARKNGREEATYDYLTTVPSEAAALATVLDKSYGVIVVQEDLMNLSRVVAGFGPGHRNALRRAIGKKKKDALAALYKDFMAGATTATVKVEDPDIDSEESIVFCEETAQRLWETFEASGDYLFNSCVPGDTRLVTGHGVGPKAESWTVQRLYDMLYGDETTPAGLCFRCGYRSIPVASTSRTCKTCRSWLFKFNDSRGFTLLACEPDGRIRPQRVADVHCNGVAAVFRMTLDNGSVIESTANHRWLTRDGYLRADQFDSSTQLVTHEGYEPQSYQEENRLTSGDRQDKPWLEGSSNYVHVDGEPVRLKQWTSENEARCDECGVTPAHKRLERAHLDGNRTNNNPSNLAWKCVPHHKAYDYRVSHRPSRWSKGHMSGLARIVSIEPVGEHIVYDVEMAAGTDHNFVANGVISHNSHSAPYAYLAYIEAYLKANWPAYFGSALLGEKDEIVDRLGVLSSLKRSGVTVLGPDICTSGVGTITVDATTIRLGLSEIRGVRTNAEAIVAEREANGPFADLHDLVTRVKQETTTKKNVRDDEGNIISTTEEEGISDLSISAVETLIDSGACDSFGSPRAGMAICARALRHAPDVVIPDIEYGATERAVRERQGLGIVISTHPVQLLQQGRSVDRNLPVPFRISTLVAGRTGVNIDAVVAFCKTKRGQTGKMRAHLVLEDQSGAVDAIMWSQALSNFENSVGRPPREGDLVNVAVLVKSMLAVPVDADDGDMGDSDVDQPERLEVVVSTMTLYQDLGNADARTGSAVVAHPLNLVAQLPPPMLPQSAAVVEQPAAPVVALVEQPESPSVTGELAVSRDLWNIAGRRLTAAVRERTELPLSQISALVAQVRGSVKAAGTPVSVDGFTLRCEATDMSVKSVS